MIAKGYPKWVIAWVRLECKAQFRHGLVQEDYGNSSPLPQRVVMQLKEVENHIILFVH